MRGAMVVVVALVSGCGSFYQHRSGRSLPLDAAETWKHEVDYELLSQVNGQACAGETTELAARGSTRDPAANGPPALFEQAKFTAIGAAKDADGLVAVRSVVTNTNGMICVQVIGRAYRLTRLRATAGVEPMKAKPASATDLIPPRE